MIDFAALPLWGLIALFAVSAGAVWAAGTRLAYYADAIARRTGIGSAALGVLLLGGITSSPEIAVAGSAAITGNAELAVNNLLGGFAMQVAILAFADALIRKGALTQAVPDPIVLLQGTLGMLLTALVAAGITVGDIALFGAGVWSWGLFAAFLFSLRLVVQSEGNPSWQVIGQPPAEAVGQEETGAERSALGLYGRTALAGLTIFAMGYLLAQSGESIAEETGLGQSFFGAVFVAIATSLPEISTVIAAIRIRRYVMAVSDIFGTNLFDIALIFLVDLAYSGEPVLNTVGPFSVLAAMIGIVVTGIYMAGLIERRDPMVAGVGFDSLAVGTVYLGGIWMLFNLR